MNILFLALIFAIIGIILAAFRNHNLTLYFLTCAAASLCALCSLFGIFFTYADVMLPARVEAVVTQRDAIDPMDTNAVAAFNRKVSDARAPWCLRYLFYDPAYRGIQPLSSSEPPKWRPPYVDDKQ